MSTSVYMLLVLPTPEQTIGPDWASQIIQALNDIDEHDHSDGKGAKITQSGINITADLEFNNFNATELAGAVLASQAATSATPGKLHRVGNNLYYTNAAGVAIQLTTGSSVNAPGSGEISADTPASYPYTVVTGDAQKVLLIDTSAARTINLPAATNAMFFMIKDKAGTAQTNNITVTPDGTDTIDGANSNFTLNSNYGSWGFVSDGVSAWYVV